VWAVSDEDNGTGNDVTNRSSMHRVDDIGRASESKATGWIADVTLTSRRCRAFCYHSREREQRIGWCRGSGWSTDSTATAAATAAAGSECACKEEAE
jgi:hypothetical protein